MTDDLGNRESHGYRGATAIGYGHDKANRMITMASKTQNYDAAGSKTVKHATIRPANSI